MAAFDPLTSCSTSCRASETQVSLRMRELWRRTRAPLVVMPGRCALSRLVPWVDDAQGHASRHHSPLGLSTCLGGADAGSVRCSCGLGRHPRYATRCWPRWCMLPPGYCASLVDRRASTRRLVQERSPVRITDPRMQQVTHIFPDAGDRWCSSKPDARPSLVHGDRVIVQEPANTRPWAAVRSTGRRVLWR